MAAAVSSPLPDDLRQPLGLLQLLLDTSLTGVMLLSPRYDAAAETITDFAWVSLNPAAQRQLNLPARPADSFLTLFPTADAAGIFEFYRDAFISGEVARRQNLYQADGLDSYYVLVAQRHENVLVVNFTDTNNQPRTAVEEALRASQAREQQALAEARHQQQLLRQVFENAPMPLALFRGNNYQVELANPALAAMWGRPLTQVLGRPVFEALPDLRDQGFEERLAGVLRTGQPFRAQEIPAVLAREHQNLPALGYFNLTYEALYEVPGAPATGILASAVEVTEQVLARQQVEQLNLALEARVLARTQELELARAATERQRQQWEELFWRAPAAICIFDGPEWVYQFVNPGYQAMFPGRELLGKRLVDALPEVADQPLMDILRRVYDTGEPFQAREVLVPLARTAAGPVEDIYFDLTYLARYNEAGQIDGFITYANDVTEQVLARRQREAQQGELQRILEQAPVGIAVFRGPQHIIEMANDLQLAIWDKPLAEALGQGLFELLPEVAGQGFEERLAGVLATGEPFVGVDVPARYTRHGVPEQIFVSFVYTPLREADGRIEAVVVVVTNTTEQVLARRQAETLQAALLATAQRQVQQREELYQIFAQAPAAIVLLREPDHRIEYVNPAYQQYFPGVALRGRLLVEAHPRVVGSETLARLDRVYATGEPYVGQEQPVNLTLTPGQPARPRYFNFTYQPYREQGRIVGVSIFAYDVTEAALTRRQAAQQARQFQELYEQAPMAVCILRGPDFVVELANPAILHIWGLTAEESLGRPRLELIPETSRASLRAVLETAYRTRQPHHVQEFPVVLGRRHTGQPDLGYFNFIYQPLFDEQGEPVALTCVGIEVTEQVLARQQVEQLNQELEARVQARTQEAQVAQAAAERERTLLQALLTQAPVAIGLFQGEEIRVAAANEMMAAMWGYTPAQVLGRPLVEGVPELRGQGFDEMLREVLRTQVPILGTEVPAQLLRDGELKTTYYNFVYQPLYNAEGEVLGVIDVATEVTEQVEARRRIEQLNQELETRVQERTRQLTEQQSLLRQILGQVPAAIATMSGPAHRFTFFNEPYLAQVGHRAALGKSVAEALPEVVGQGYIDLLDQVYLSGQRHEGREVPFQLHDRSAGGQPVHYLNFVYQPLADGQGRTTGILVFAIDVTEQVLARRLVDSTQRQVQELNQELAVINEELRSINEELLVSNTRLTRTNTDLDTFVYTASHDLKAPITNIEGILNALRDTLPEPVQQDPVVSHLMGLLDHTVGRFLLTIGQLTDLSRLQQTYNEPAQLLLLSPVVADVLADLAPAISAAAAQVYLTIPTGLQVSFAPSSLRSVVYNLLSNAIKYRSPERPAQVWLRAEQQAGTLVLTVRDNGLGLTETQQKRLFGVFQRLHTHVEGTGVGLYMIKRLIDNAGATITVTSSPGVGTTFTVAFPA